MTISKSELWAEMARRKVRFHFNDDPETLKLWGLFNWGQVSKYLQSGLLITDMKKENRIIWVWPASMEIYNQHIKPLIENFSLYDLTIKTGWLTVDKEECDELDKRLGRKNLTIYI